MIKLLDANLYRLRKSVAFWILFIIIGFFGIYLYFNNYTPTINGGTNQLGAVFFYYSIIIGFLIPIFICLFIGDDYSNGTIRNKITYGYRRNNIYLANLITCIIATFIYTFLFILLITIVGNIVDNSFTVGLDKTIYILLDTFLVNISFCSLFTFIATIISNKTTSSIISLSLTMWALLFVSNLPYKIASTVGIKKIILQFCYDFIQLGQSYQLANLTGNYGKIAIYSTITIMIINLCGLYYFKYKDID